MKDTIRLDKYLTEMGEGTRSQIKEMARKGRISVNGVTEKKSERKISPSSDTVAVDGRNVSYVEYEYYMLHKPQGVVSATEDRLHETVVELITDRKRDDLFPVGRLDIDTEGLLLLTNDGDLTHRLAEGLVLSDGTETLPADLEVVHRGDSGELSEILLTIHEGKFHQVKRMFETLGCHVVYLKRLSMGTLVLDEALKPGEYRPLTHEELELLKKTNQE